MPDDNDKNDLGELLGGLSDSMQRFRDEHGELEYGEALKYPLEVSAILSQGGRGMELHDVGSLVRIRPVKDEKTYLGIYLGDLLRSIMVARGSKSKALFLTQRMNPAIWVFELNKVVWGDSSWWGTIDSEKDLERCISDADIDGIWYVKLLREMFAKKTKEDADA